MKKQLLTEGGIMNRLKSFKVDGLRTSGHLTGATRVGSITSKHPRRSRCWLPILVAAVLFAASPAPLLAGGGQHYPNGVTDFMSGVLPPPGFYWLNYLTYITKDKLADRDGN